MRFGLLAIVSTLAGCASSPSHLAAVMAPAPRSFEVRIIGAGPPMILIPGLTCAGDVWDGVVAHFRARYQLHVLTLAGFAGEPSIPPPFLDTVRRDLIRYIDEKRLVRPVLVGHSLGGFLAYWVGASAPERVGRVIAVDGVPFLADFFEPGATVASVKPQAEQMRRMTASLAPDQFALQNQMTLKSLMTDPKDVERVANGSNRSDPRAVGEAIYELMTTDLREQVAQLKAPTLLVAAGAFAKDEGGRTELRARCESQLAKIPDHRIVVAERARHFVMLDQPAFLYSAIESFLAEGKN